MGILDSKTRVIDLILTNEGKRQLVNGQMITEYVSFSDSSISYDNEDLEKLILEANNLPQDEITPEADANELIRKILTPNFKIINGNIFDLKSNTISGSNEFFISGSISNEFFDEIAKSSFENFNKLQIINSYDSFEDINNISTDKLNDKFTIRNDDNFIGKLNINNMDSIFLDPDASTSLNYLYLPPIDNNENPIFDYGFKKNTNKILTNDDLLKRLDTRKKITFNIESLEKAFIQIYQNIPNSTKLKKLDIIKYGNINDLGVVYFVGRLLVDDTGNSTFYRMFTLVLK